MNERYYKNERYVMRKFGQEGLMIPLRVEPKDMKKMFSLNPLACQIWESLEGKSFQQLKEQIINNFEVDEKTASTDLSSFLEMLLNDGFIEKRPSKTG